MIFPIVLYGDPVLNKRAINFERSETDTIQKLVLDMFETMYQARGVGLAAPQIGISKRIFVVDGAALDKKECKNFKKVFVNPTILEQKGTEWEFEEGCLSIPGIREYIGRQESLTLHYFDENWVEFTETFVGMQARIIQHEYDHLEGLLFTDRISGFKKRLLQGKLNKIKKGITDADYKVKTTLKK
jgi:peptide deformylase